jgi:hypothetical protein
MQSGLRIGRHLLASLLAAIAASFLIGLLGMLVKVAATGNGVAYFASVAGAILAIGVSGPGMWLTLALVFAWIDRRNAAAARPISRRTAGALWGVAHSVLAVILTALQAASGIGAAAYLLALVTGTAVTSAMVYLPPAPDHVLILLAPVLVGWLAGGLYGLVYGRGEARIQGAAPATVH